MSSFTYKVTSWMKSSIWELMHKKFGYTFSTTTSIAATFDKNWLKNINSASISFFKKWRKNQLSMWEHNFFMNSVGQSLKVLTITNNTFSIYSRTQWGKYAKWFFLFCSSNKMCCSHNLLLKSLSWVHFSYPNNWIKEYFNSSNSIFWNKSLLIRVSNSSKYELWLRLKS